jgi:hypothetical protein
MRKSGKPDLRGPSARTRAVRRVAPGSRLARAYRNRAQNRRRGARLAGTREGCREDAALRALGRDTSALPHNSYLPVKQRSLLRSRRAFCARVSLFLFPSTPNEGRAERRKGAVFLLSRCRARRSALTEARRASSGTRSPLGAPPWRFSVGGRASISGISSGFVQRAPRSQVVVPGGRGPEPPGALVTSRGRRTPLPAPPSGSSLEDAPR